MHSIAKEVRETELFEIVHGFRSHIQSVFAMRFLISGTSSCYMGRAVDRLSVLNQRGLLHFEKVK